MNEKRLTTRDAAEYLGVCKQRISAKIQQGHYKRVSKCECGLTTMIPLAEINRDMTTKPRRKRK